MKTSLSILAGLATSLGAVSANPDGAPWGAANRAAVQNCVSCHFDGEPVEQSKAIALEGLPNSLMPGEIYELVLTFKKSEHPIAGFLATTSAGAFYIGGVAQQTNANAIRSTAPHRGAGAALWPMKWRAPENSVADVTFYIAINAGNDDQSVFGDQIHFKTIVINADE